MKHNKKVISLWIVFGIYFFCYMAVEINLGVLLSIWSIGLSIYLLVKTKLPSKKRILLSAIFAFLVSIAYWGLNMGITPVIINGLIAGVPTLLCSLAVFSVMEKNYEIKIISKGKKYAPLVSIVIGVSFGVVLSAVNILLMKDSNTVDFRISISRLLVCLCPAIFEEIACRAIFMAFCLYTVGKEKASKFQQFTIWFMMCFPHTVAHGYDMGSTILLCILFGLPFTILQRKRDITSAMISHGIVDAIRFTIFGTGM